MKNIAIFASGSGSNAEAIVKYFKEKGYNPIKLILTNNPRAYVIERAKMLNIPCICFNKSDLYESSKVSDILKEYQIDFIVLAGFLWLLPTSLIKLYEGKIVNIHPALLPNYGGKGMYGMNVHRAVVANGEKQTGITIHLVDEEYDHGKILFQAKCNIDPLDTPEKVAEKVHQLEYMYYPRVIEELIKN